jgi:threonine dehydrogenase-like Zn-dependent dehydrogenase
VEEFGGPEVMKLIETPQLPPGPGEVLVRMEAVGVNPVETYIRAGTYPRKPALPFTPGNDGAGEVEEVGPPSSQTSNAANKKVSEFGPAIGFTRRDRSAGPMLNMPFANRSTSIACRRKLPLPRARRWALLMRRHFEG